MLTYKPEVELILEDDMLVLDTPWGIHKVADMYIPLLLKAKRMFSHQSLYMQIDCHAYPGHPAILNRAPEDCSPEEPPELEIQDLQLVFGSPGNFIVTYICDGEMELTSLEAYVWECLEAEDPDA